MHKISVVFVSSVFERGREGPAIYARYLYDYFVSSATIDFHLVVSELSKSLPNVHVAGLGSSSYDTYKRLQLKAIEVANRLGGRAIVHGNSANTMWLFTKYKGPLLVQVNDYDSATVIENTLWYMRNHQFRRYISLLWRRFNEQRVVATADRIICNSNFTLRAIERHYKKSTDRLSVIYKAVDTVFFSRPVEYAGNRKDSIKKLIFVGTNWRRKGLEDLLQAINLCRDQIPEVRLDIIGTERDELPGDLLEWINANQLHELINFVGMVSRENLPKYFWESDIAVLPSHHEALGVAILEALASGTPVLATDVGGIPEILAGYDCGVMVSPGRPEILAEKIVGMLKGDMNLHAMRLAAIRRAKDFSSTTMLECVEQMYKECHLKEGQS